MKFAFVALFVAAVVGDAGIYEQEWCYVDVKDASGAVGCPKPDGWVKNYPDCDETKTRQSPVDLKQADMVRATVEHFEQIDLTGYGVRAAQAANKGSTLSVVFEGERLTIVDPYGVRYANDNLHFHWGKRTGVCGSEHTVNGRCYALEAHFVHYRADFANLHDAAESGDPNALTVIGVLYEEEDGYVNEHLEKLLAPLDQITAVSTDKVAIENVDVFDLMGGVQNPPFFHYNGSLTTPGCTEIVQWYVLQNVQKIGTAQLAKFRALSFTNHPEDPAYAIESNARPVQQMAGRKIFISPAHDNAARENSPCLLCIAAATLLVLFVVACFCTKQQKVDPKPEAPKKKA